MDVIRELVTLTARLEKRIDDLVSSAEHATYHAARGKTYTIASGAIDATRANAYLLPQSGTADDLDTINGGFDGKLIILRTTVGNTITVKHNTGNIDLIGSTNDVVLDDPLKTLQLIYLESESKWVRFDYMTLDDLFGVYISSTPSIGDVLAYTGTDWQPSSLISIPGITSSFAASVGDTIATDYVVNHALGTQDVVVSVRLTSAPYTIVYPDIEVTDNDNVTVKFVTPPAASEYRVVVIG